MEAKKWRTEVAISVLSLLVSFAALAFTLWYNLSPGIVRPLEPSGYSIIRELGTFPSDHLVLPLEWENTSGHPALIRSPYLVLRELSPDGNETGKEYHFSLAGEYPEISSRAFANHYEHYRHQNSFSLEPHTLSQRVLVFHIEKWWDTTSDLYDFRFKGGERYRVHIGFQRDVDEQTETRLFDMPIYDSANRLDRAGEEKYWWDYWTLR